VNAGSEHKCLVGHSIEDIGHIYIDQQNKKSYLLKRKIKDKISEERTSLRIIKK